MERIKISLGKTFNLGNFESLRIDVGLEKDVEKATSKLKQELYVETMALLKAAALKANEENSKLKICSF